MSRPRSLLRRLFDSVPADSRLLYRLCKRYVDRYNGENDDDIKSNGELRLMRQMLPECRIVFDIGANIGHWAKMALAINPKIKLYCFEPSLTTFERLITNTFPGNVVCNNFGFSSETKEMKLHVFGDGSGLNSLYKRQGLEDGWGLAAQNRDETIRLHTVDGFCKDHSIFPKGINFCKLDVEGHELEVFRGMKEMLSEGLVDVIQFEYGGANIDARVLLLDIFNFFQPLNYKFYRIFPNGLRHIPRYDQQLENFKYQNWAIISSRLNISNLS